MIDTDEIRAKVDVQRLYAELFPSLTGKHAKMAHCFRTDAHNSGDRSPSVQLHRNGFHCHGCGERFDAIGLVMAATRCGFKQAVDYLAGRFNLTAVQPAARAIAPWSWPMPDVECEAILQEVWSMTRNLEPTPEAIRWLTSRGIGVDVAWALGCRDWSPVLPELRAMLEQNAAWATKANLVANGELWWPMRGDHLPGLCVPSFVPGIVSPFGYRWRFFQPVEMHGKRLKCAAQSNAQPVPLGVRVTGTDGLASSIYGSSILVIAEGEPDWLSIHDALAGCVGVLGICDVSGGWRSAWSELLRGTGPVIVATHAKKGDPIGTAVLGALTDLDPKHGRSRYLRLELREDCDANDLHKRGKLLPLLIHALKERFHV